MARKNKPCPCGSGKRYGDCCRAKDEAARHPPARAEVLAWAPAVLFAGVAAYVILRSTSAHDYAHAAYWAQDAALSGLSILFFVFAAFLFLIPPLRDAASRHLDRLSSAAPGRRALWLGATFAGVFVWLGFIRFCEYRAYLLPTDTSIEVENAYVFLHHGAMYYPLWGMHVLSQHFFFLMAVFAPILWIWKSSLAILFLQHLCLCSVPFAVYFLLEDLTASALAGAAGMILALSSPSFYELLTANIDVVPLPAFFLWAMVFLRRRRWLPFGLFVVLMGTCKEQVPFIYLGLGLYSIYGLRERKPWNWAVGAALCAASLALWAGELSLIKHYEKLEPELNAIGTSKWELFMHLVPAGTPSDRIIAEILGHPFRTLGRLFSSVYTFYPLLRALFSMGFLCLLSPMRLLPFLTAILPHVLANPGAPCKFLDYHPLSYFDLGLHHPAYMYGPLLWATAGGIAVAHEKLSGRGLQGWILAWALFFSGFGLKYAHRTLNPNWRENWFDAMPRVQALIPGDARLWGDEYALAPLATRSWMKNIQWGPEPPAGYKTLFKPDYALFTKEFVAYAKPPYRDQMLTFFCGNKYRKIADDSNIVLLRSPDPSPDPDATPPVVALPAVTEQTYPIARDCARYILQNPPDKL